MNNAKYLSENNMCHNNEKIFDHSWLVFINSKKIISLLPKNQINNLNNVYQENKRKHLFLTAVLLHDIGKIKTIISSEKQTDCPNHEKIGAKMIKNIFKKKLNKKEIIYLFNFVKNHSLVHIALNNRKSFNKEYDKLIQNNPNLIKEFTIFSIADILHSHFKNTNFNDYSFRIRKLQEKLNIDNLTI